MIDPNLDKKLLLSLLIQEAQRRLQVLRAAADDAKEGATHEESKAENKYDTRGLEASYLAAGHNQRAAELKQAIDQLQKFEPHECQRVSLGALVELENENGESKLFFIVPYMGGENLQIEGISIRTISPQAPLIKKSLNQKINFSFEHHGKPEPTEFTIVDIR